jgi:hypothetical protein
MKTLQEKIAHYRELAALIRDLATNPTMREMFDQLHQHLTQLADEVDRPSQFQVLEQSTAYMLRMRQAVDIDAG